MPTASIHQDRFNISPFPANLHGHEKWAKTALRAAPGASMNPSFPNSATRLLYRSLRLTGSEKEEKIHICGEDKTYSGADITTMDIKAKITEMNHMYDHMEP